MKLGVRLGHWSSLDQVYIDSKGKTGRRLYADWHIPTEEYENYGILKLLKDTVTAAAVYFLLVQSYGGKSDRLDVLK